MRPPSILLPPPLVCFLLLCSAQNTSCIIHVPFHAPILLCWTSILSSLPRVLTYWAVQRRWFARVNALCNLSHKKTREVAASNATTVAVAKITGERGWKVDKKKKKEVSLRRFWADQKIGSLWKNVFWGIL